MKIHSKQLSGLKCNEENFLPNNGILLSKFCLDRSVYFASSQSHNQAAEYNQLHRTTGLLFSDHTRAFCQMFDWIAHAIRHGSAARGRTCKLTDGPQKIAQETLGQNTMCTGMHLVNTFALSPSWAREIHVSPPIGLKTHAALSEMERGVGVGSRMSAIASWRACDKCGTFTSDSHAFKHSKGLACWMNTLSPRWRIGPDETITLYG